MAERDQSRTRILDAAAATLRARGLAGARLSEIAKIAGMLAPSLYHHFGSKDELVEEVMMEGIYHNTRHIVSHVEVLGSGASPIQRLETAIRSHIDFLLTGDDYSSAVARVFDDLPDDMKKRVVAAYSGFDNYWRDLIVAAQKDGSADADLDPTVVRKFLIAMLNSSSSWYRPGKLGPAQIAEQAARMVISGFAAR
ncbi:TetR/AcrR family transcriptional regulator [Sphingomonas sp. CGMCC 1.13654]|uniref:TetR/AcrR family transcriptional regulator n=1 Tax=Sphingomonas chungangi TaxID=2683589 RepID=A0A838L636_9SPHN|nr:TetR/AcrR family transcriptional regulator [Sphingomonas chungangi]MBA2933929.1 TetR/AcrR family transcriptional regulator [Sphingomonas chungangi]MVW57057.1 TetR family transcriptional regulator [Sphingomonas chungangi]